MIHFVISNMFKATYLSLSLFIFFLPSGEMQSKAIHSKTCSKQWHDIPTIRLQVALEKSISSLSKSECEIAFEMSIAHFPTWTRAQTLGKDRNKRGQNRTPEQSSWTLYLWFVSWYSLQQARFASSVEKGLLCWHLLAHFLQCLSALQGESYQSSSPHYADLICISFKWIELHGTLRHHSLVTCYPYLKNLKGPSSGVAISEGWIRISDCDAKSLLWSSESNFLELEDYKKRSEKQ